MPARAPPAGAEAPFRVSSAAASRPRLRRVRSPSRRFALLQDAAVLDALCRDLQYSVRRLRREPGFAAAVVATLALGFGANTAVLAFVYGYLVNPLPFRDGDRLTTIIMTAPSLGRDRSPMSYSEFQDLRARARTLSGVAASRLDSVALHGADEQDGRPLVRRLRSGLVAFQIGAATMVLVTTGLMVKGVLGLQQPPGFDPSNVLTMEINLPDSDRFADPSSRHRFFDDLLTKVRSHAGVVSAGAANPIPTSGGRRPTRRKGCPGRVRLDR